MKHKVSVFIPVYNTEKYIGKAIRSVLEQTYTDFELIILDDCSNDNTHQIISQIAKQDNRIKIFRNKENLGMMANWNKGISLCKGKYWGKLDADDYWGPTVLENSVSILDNYDDVGLVCGKYKIVDENNKITPSEQIPEFLLNKSFSTISLVKAGPEKMFQYNILRQGIGLLRMSVFKDFGLFLLMDSGDTEMWYRIGAHYNIYCFDKLFSYHRIWSASYMRQNVDVDIERRNKNLFDTRNTIIEYYYKNNKITDFERTEMINKNKFIYNSFLISKNRKKHNYFKMIKYLLENFNIDIKQTLKENLHLLNNR